uniref:DDE_Tnp_1_7 domain-containing protein n=1 Tax=Ascaris lumbricoides TaxID=6252 RepID=A0A0M3HVU7_ASCLU
MSQRTGHMVLHFYELCLSTGGCERLLFSHLRGNVVRDITEYQHSHRPHPADPAAPWCALGTSFSSGTTKRRPKRLFVHSTESARQDRGTFYNQMLMEMCKRQQLIKADYNKPVARATAKHLVDTTPDYQGAATYLDGIIIVRCTAEEH